MALLRVQPVIRHQPRNGLADLSGADKPRALKLPLCMRMPRTPAEIRMAEKIHSLLKGTVSCEIFRTIGNRIPVTSKAMALFPVDAKHPIAQRFQKIHRLYPASGIVPVFGLARGLRCNADIGLCNGP